MSFSPPFLSVIARPKAVAISCLSWLSSSTGSLKENRIGDPCLLVCHPELVEGSALNHHSSLITHHPRRSAASGFGLLEVLISTGILAMIVGAAVTLATSSLKNSILGTNRTVASQLAQEGIELARQMRDTSYIDGGALGTANSWTSYFDLAKCSGPTAACQLKQDPNKRWMFVLGAEVIDVVGGASDATTTAFTRSLRVEPVDALSILVPSNAGGEGEPLALKITSTVSWQDHGRTPTAVSATVLTDWRPTQ